MTSRDNLPRLAHSSSWLIDLWTASRRHDLRRRNQLMRRDNPWGSNGGWVCQPDNAAHMTLFSCRDEGGSVFTIQLALGAAQLSQSVINSPNSKGFSCMFADQELAQFSDCRQPPGSRDHAIRRSTIARQRGSVPGPGGSVLKWCSAREYSTQTSPPLCPLKVSPTEAAFSCQARLSGAQRRQTLQGSWLGEPAFSCPAEAVAPERAARRQTSIPINPQSQSDPARAGPAQAEVLRTTSRRFRAPQPLLLIATHRLRQRPQRPGISPLTTACRELRPRTPPRSQLSLEPFK